jgi:predicted RNase H-like HicB family nuclease
MEQQIRIVVHTDEDGSLWSEVPDYPGVFASGANMDELLEATVEAVTMVINDTPSRPEPVADVLPMVRPEVRKLRPHYSVREVGVDLELAEA